jgi:putative transposase
MPERAHLLIWPTEREYDISAIPYSIKKPVTNWALSYVRNEAPAFLKRMEDRQPSGELRHRFWQRGSGSDRNVVEPETVLRQTEYLHLNPVRRGLCEVPEDWFWSSAAEYAGVRVGPLTINRQSLPRIGPC